MFRKFKNEDLNENQVILNKVPKVQQLNDILLDRSKAKGKTTSNLSDV